MENRSAKYFAKDLQKILNVLVKDEIVSSDTLLLRVVLPKEWRGRALAFVSYLSKSKYVFTFRINNYLSSKEKYLAVHSYKDGIMYFIFTKKREFIESHIVEPPPDKLLSIID